MAVFTGIEPVTTLSDNFSALLTLINDSANGQVNYIADTGVVNSIVLTLASAPIAYQPGMTVAFVAATTNTGATVINVNTLGTVSVVDVQGNPLKAGAIVAGQISTLVYNGTSFMLTYRYPFNTSITFTGAPTINCSGISSLSVSGNITATATATLTNLVGGIPLFFNVSNVSGAGQALAIQGAAPFNGSSLARYVTNASVATATNMQTTSIVVPTGTAFNFQGSPLGGAIAWTGVIA